MGYTLNPFTHQFMFVFAAWCGINLKVEKDELEILEGMSKEDKFILHWMFEDLLKYMVENSGLNQLIVDLSIKEKMFHVVIRGQGDIKENITTSSAVIDRIKARLIILSGFVSDDTDWRSLVHFAIPINL